MIYEAASDGEEVGLIDVITYKQIVIYYCNQRYIEKEDS